MGYNGGGLCPYYCSTDREAYCTATGGVAWCRWCEIDVEKLIREENGECDDEEDAEDECDD